MREMRDSGIEWIGEIPKDWDTTKLKYLVQLRNEKTKENNSEIPYIGLEHVAPEVGSLMESYVPITDFTGDTIDYKKGDILFGKLRPYLAKAIEAECDGRCSSEFWVMEPKKIIGRFLLYSVLSNHFVACINHSTFGVKMPRAEWDFAGNQEISYPDVDVQTKIARYLDRKCHEIDTLITAKEKSNALLKERRQSVIYEAVTKGLNPDVPMKDSGIAWIGSIPETWRVAPLKRFATIRSGLTLGKKYPDGTKLVEYPYLRVANVQGEYTDLTDIATVSVTESEAELYALHAGELLMTEGGDRDKLGRGCVWEGQISPCLHQNHVFALTTNEELNIYYVDYLTTSDVGRNYFDFTAKKTTNLASTNATTILAFPIPIPCRKEQDAIVSYLREKCAEIDNIISANETIIAKLKEYRQSVIYEAVTGKIEV